MKYVYLVILIAAVYYTNYYKFVFYITFMGILLHLPLALIADKLKSGSKIKPYIEGLSVIAILASAGLGVALYIGEAHYVDPLIAKVSKYPATELVFTFEDNTTQNESERMQAFLREYFSKRKCFTYRGGSTYVKGNQLLKRQNGYLDNYWKFNENVLSLYLSLPLTKEEISDLKEALDEWFTKSKEVIISGEVSLKLDTDTLPYLFFHPNYKLDLDENLTVIITPNRLSFSVDRRLVFPTDRSSSRAKNCIVSLEMRKGVYEDALKTFVQGQTAINVNPDRESATKLNERLKAVFDEFSKVQFKALFSDGSSYEARIYTQRDLGESGIRTSEFEARLAAPFSYTQYLLLTLSPSVSEERETTRKMCKELIKREVPLYSMYLQTKRPKELPTKLKAFAHHNIMFSPFYEEVEMLRPNE